MAKASTYAATKSDLENPPETVVSDTAVVESPETIASPATTEVKEDAGAEPVKETPTKEKEEPKEDNVSDFSISLDGEKVTEGSKTTATAKISPTFNWKEEIKKIDRKELVKEIGLSEFAIELNDYLDKGGKAEDYLHAKAIDYNKISDEDLIKDGLTSQYPNLSREEIARKYNRKYGITDDMLDDEIEDRKIEVKADAHNIRQQKISEQQKFKIPENNIVHKDEAYEQWKRYQESRPQLLEEVKDFYNSHEATKALNESKRVTVNLGEGVPPFNFSIDRPELITETLTDDGSNWRKLTNTQSGEPDVAKQQLLTMIAFNPQKFIHDIFNYGQQWGVREKIVGEGQNAQRPQAKVHSLDANATPTYGVGKFGDKSR